MGATEWLVSSFLIAPSPHSTPNWLVGISVPLQCWSGGEGQEVRKFLPDWCSHELALLSPGLADVQCSLALLG